MNQFSRFYDNGAGNSGSIPSGGAAAAGGGSFPGSSAAVAGAAALGLPVLEADGPELSSDLSSLTDSSSSSSDSDSQDERRRRKVGSLQHVSSLAQSPGLC